MRSSSPTPTSGCFSPFKNIFGRSNSSSNTVERRASSSSSPSVEKSVSTPSYQPSAQAQQLAGDLHGCCCSGVAPSHTVGGQEPLPSYYEEFSGSDEKVFAPEVRFSPSHPPHVCCLLLLSRALPFSNPLASSSTLTPPCLPPRTFPFVPPGSTNHQGHHPHLRRSSSKALSIHQRQPRAQLQGVQGSRGPDLLP